MAIKYLDEETPTAAPKGIRYLDDSPKPEVMPTAPVEPASMA